MPNGQKVREEGDEQRRDARDSMIIIMVCSQSDVGGVCVSPLRMVGRKIKVGAKKMNTSWVDRCGPDLE